MEGKHKAAITGCAWSPDGQLAICAEDQTLSLSHENGQTFAELRLRLKPDHVSYGRADNGKDSLVSDGGSFVFVVRRSEMLYVLVWYFGEYCEKCLVNERVFWYV